MAENNTLIAWFLVSGGIAREKSYLKIEQEYSITVDGDTATAVVTSQMYVKRDSYGPTWVGGSYYYKFSDCYIAVDGVKISVLDNWDKKTDIGTSYVAIGNPVTHTITYDASTEKTATVEANFNFYDTSDENRISKKLMGIAIPTSNYTYGTGGIESGSSVLTFPAQYTPPVVELYDGTERAQHIPCVYNPTWGEYEPFIYDGTAWVSYSG